MENETGKEFGKILINIALITYGGAVIGSDAAIGFGLACKIAISSAILGIIFVKFSTKKRRW